MSCYKTETNVNGRLENKTRLFKRAHGTSKIHTFLTQQLTRQQDNQQLHSTHLYAAARPTARSAARHLDTAWRGSDRLRSKSFLFFLNLKFEFLINLKEIRRIPTQLE